MAGYFDNEASRMVRAKHSLKQTAEVDDYIELYIKYRLASSRKGIADISDANHLYGQMKAKEAGIKPTKTSGSKEEDRNIVSQLLRNITAPLDHALRDFPGSAKQIVSDYRRAMDDDVLEKVS